MAKVPVVEVHAHEPDDRDADRADLNPFPICSDMLGRLVDLPHL
jgi:hypothetical protein